MIPNYEEMRAFDISPYVSKRDGLDYLPWATCVSLLHDLGAEKVYFEPIPDPQTGTSLRMTDVEFKDKNGNINRCYETRIKIVIDDLEFVMQTPVINGSNPVKDNSLTQLRVWSSMCRAFVKGVAIRTGLGFDLWVKEETPHLGEEVPNEQISDATREAQRNTLISLCEKHHIDLQAWAESGGKTLDTLTDDDVAQMLRGLNAKYGEQA